MPTCQVSNRVSTSSRVQPATFPYGNVAGIFCLVAWLDQALLNILITEFRLLFHKQPLPLAGLLPDHNIPAPDSPPPPCLARATCAARAFPHRRLASVSLIVIR